MRRGPTLQLAEAAVAIGRELAPSGPQAAIAGGEATWTTRAVTGRRSGY